MDRMTKLAIGATVILTLAAVATWQITGGDYYTKFEVVEQVDKAIDPDDPLAAAGFYDGTSQTETVARADFRFGLLPTPSGIFDKHMLSVVSVVMPLWVISLGLMWLSRRRLQRA
jgi:hypothetical protein